MKTKVLFENEYCIILSNGIRIDRVLNTITYISVYFDNNGKLQTI